MNCLEFRRKTLIDPGDPSPAMAMHKEQCPNCAKFAEQIAHQDELIKEAVDIDVPEGFAARILLNQSLQAQSRRPTRWYWLSLAASFFVALMLFPLFTSDDPEPVIASHAYHGPEILVHMEAHDVLHTHYDSMAKAMDVEQVLADANTAMPTEFGNVIYAATCVIEGELVAHLLMKNGNSEYVVFLIPQSTLIDGPFNNERFDGQMARLNNRTMAVFSHAGDTGLDEATEVFSQQFAAPLGSGETI